MMLGFLVFLLIVMLDQLTKFIILKNFPPGVSLPVIKDIFHLTFVCNKGMAFGIFSQRQSSFIWICLISILITALIVAAYKRAFSRSWLSRFYLSLILSGAASNLIDRIRLGCVVDFLDLRIWPVFNIADMAITIGTALLILQIFKHHPLTFTL